MKQTVNYRTDNKKAAFSMLGLLLVSALGISLSLQGGWLWFIGNVMIAALMWSWFSILHSAGHNTYFRNRTANSVAGHIASLFVMVPFYTWQASHAAHHRWTGYKDLDPSANEIPETKPSPRTLKVLEVLWALGLPVLSLWHAWSGLLTSAKPEIKNKARFSQACLYIPHLVFLIIAPLMWVKIFALPYLVFLLLSDAVLLSQHAFFPLEHSSANGSHKAAQPFALEKQELVSRSFHIHPWIDRWVFLNFNLHSAHHLYPQVPHYHLDEIEFKPTHSTHLWTWWKTLRRAKLEDLLWGNHT